MPSAFPQPHPGRAVPSTPVSSPLSNHGVHLGRAVRTLGATSHPGGLDRPPTPSANPFRANRSRRGPSAPTPPHTDQSEVLT